MRTDKTVNNRPRQQEYRDKYLEGDAELDPIVDSLLSVQFRMPFALGLLPHQRVGNSP